MLLANKLFSRIRCDFSTSPKCCIFQYIGMFVITVFYGCSTSVQQAVPFSANETPLKTFKLDSTVTIESKDLIADISVVRLESSWKNVIGHIDQLLFADDKIIVFDQRKAKAVFVFDRNGKFLNRIGMLGHGPQEYVEPSYIALVPGKEQVAVFDLSPKKVKIYELDGKFVQSEDIPIYIFSAEYLTDQIKVGATIGRRYFSIPEYGRASLYMFNKNWEVTSIGFQDQFQESLTYTSTNNLKKFGDRVYFTPAYEDRIYRVYPDSIQLLYQLDFGDRALPSPEKYHISESREFEVLLRTHHTFQNFADFEQWTMLKTADNSLGRTFFYDKIKDSVFCLSTHIYNPLENYFHTADYYYNDNCIVSSVDAATIATLIPWMQQFAKAVPQSKQTEQIIEQLSSVTENNNPVLFFFTLKSGR